MRRCFSLSCRHQAHDELPPVVSRTQLLRQPLESVLLWRGSARTARIRSRSALNHNQVGWACSGSAEVRIVGRDRRGADGMTDDGPYGERRRVACRRIPVGLKDLAARILSVIGAAGRTAPAPAHSHRRFVPSLTLLLSRDAPSEMPGPSTANVPDLAGPTDVGDATPVEMPPARWAAPCSSSAAPTTATVRTRHDRR